MSRDSEGTRMDERNGRIALADGTRDVRRIGFGTMSASGSYGAVEPDRARAAIRSALDLGAVMIDTADVYGDGAAERMIGEVRVDGDDVLIATKVGLRRNPDARFGVDIDGSPQHLRAAVQGSCQRLGVETLDLVYLHRVADDVPVEDSIGALGDLVVEGAVLGVGISEASTDSIRRAHGTHPLSAVQSELSLWSRDVAEAGVLDLCAELGVPFVASSPLGKGFLTGALIWPPEGHAKDSRRRLPRFSAESYPGNRAVLSALAEVAGSHGCTMAQAALAWVLASTRDGFAIPGTSSPERVAENAAATSVALTAAEVTSLGEAFAPDRIAGDRYADMRFVGR